MNGLIEEATGDLVAAGYSTFIAGAGQAVRNDVPEPAFCRDTGAANYHQWNGSTWDLVPQRALLVGKYRVTSNLTNNTITDSLYATDNGDGTYDDLVEETVYTYSNGHLISKTTTIYYDDGGIHTQRSWSYYRNSTKSIEKETT